MSSRVRHGTTVVPPHRRLSQAQVSRTLADAAGAFATVVRQLGVDDETAEAALRTALAQR